MQIRNQQYHILAPQNGFVVKAAKAGLGETIRKAIPFVASCPTNMTWLLRCMWRPWMCRCFQKEERCAFNSMDDLPFSSQAGLFPVGTFGGIVQVIDYVNTKPGEFRILVVPDQKMIHGQSSCMGGGIKGWVMLENVRVWFWNVAAVERLSAQFVSGTLKVEVLKRNWMAMENRNSQSNRKGEETLKLCWNFLCELRVFVFSRWK